MKYEMIFGDESLFDGAPDDAEMVYETANHVRVYYKKCNSLKFFSNNKWVRVLNEKDMIIYAMRRIIKEPKRWTWEDKKSGRLPEVGSRIFVPLMQEEQNVIYTSKNVIISISDSDGAVTRTEVKSIDRINPIETLAEKAQREEDEFVTSLCKELDGTSLQHDSIYERGVRAAYRKLKGGE